MKVTGFSFIKNAIKYDYPIVEAIRSILPICDEIVVAVGDSEDETYELIQQIDPKIRIIQTVWDETLREGGKVLAVETDKAFAAISPDTDWAFYIQGDEVIHEEYLPVVRDAMEKYKDDPKVDGLLFNYLHFYGSYDYVGSADNWYPHEIRVIKNNPSIYSYKDAQGFRKGENEKLRVKPINAWMYHYGWVKDPRAMQKKQEDFNKLWHDDNWIEENIAKVEEFDYFKGISSLYRFEKTHPAVMKERLERINWKFDYDLSFNKRSFKYRAKGLLKNYFGLDFSHNNYIKIQLFFSYSKRVAPSSEKKWVSCIIEQMKSKNVILLILVVLLVFPSNAIFAIGNKVESHSIEKSCCCTTSSSTGEKSCCSSSGEHQEKNDCGSNCGDNSCHCPIPICIPLFVDNTVFSTRKLFATPSLGWMYLQNIPKAISISIWQPPKIGQCIL